jgi:hypothetical protein
MANMAVGQQYAETWDVDRLGALQPDAVAIDKVKKVICILEYTCPSDTRVEALCMAAARKTFKYQVLQAALRHYRTAGWRVYLFQLPVGVRGSLLHAHWIPALEALAISQKHFREILQVAATASVRATHLLHVCRHKRHRAPETVSLRYRVREYAKESWGPLPPPI